MTKEEFIKQMVKYRRKGKSYAIDLACYDLVGGTCDDCPYVDVRECWEQILDTLLDRIIQLEGEK